MLYKCMLYQFVFHDTTPTSIYTYSHTLSLHDSRPTSTRDKQFPTADQIKAECLRLAALEQFSDFDLLRIYFYDAPPANKKITNPVSGDSIDLGATSIYSRNSQMRSEEHTSELQSLMRISYAVFCLKKKKTTKNKQK